VLGFVAACGVSNELYIEAGQKPPLATNPTTATSNEK
jgi:hypothetical protein